jgi:succinoglycan biosynthesis transport protein ExoP
MELSDILAIIGRRKWHLIIPLILLTAVAAIIAYSLTPIYRSTATIVIDKQEVPPNVIESFASSGYADEKIEKTARRVMTSENLLKVINANHLYPDLMSTGQAASAADRVRENTTRETVDVEVRNPHNGKSGTATIAFTVSFDHPDPAKAQKVADALAQLYLKESRQESVEQAANVSTFLKEESARLGKKVSGLEDRLASFKQKNVDKLPGLMDMNLRFIENNRTQLDRVSESIRSLEAQRIELEGELEQLRQNPPSVNVKDEQLMSPGQRLAALRADYLRLSGVYSPEHPDLVRIRREIQTLDGQVQGGSETARLVSELARARMQLAQLKTRYTDAYPDVKRAEAKVRDLRAKLSSLASGGASGQDDGGVASNPTYIAKRSRLTQVVAELKSARAEKASLQQQVVAYQKRVEQSPEVEKQYLALSRDYENALKKYREIKDKEMEAQLAVQLERERKGDRFSLSQAATLPTAPVKPNRLAIVLLGAFVAFTAGVGSSWVAEYRDDAVHGSRGVASIFGAPPLATIPHISNLRDRSRHRRRQATTWIFGILIGVAALTAVHLYWLPLDSVWSGSQGDGMAGPNTATSPRS